jgi:hypothetical protein
MKAAYAALSACREGWLISGGYGGLHAERRRRSNPIVSSVLFDRNELVGQLLRPSPVGISKRYADFKRDPRSPLAMFSKSCFTKQIEPAGIPKNSGRREETPV